MARKKIEKCKVCKRRRATKGSDACSACNRAAQALNGEAPKDSAPALRTRKARVQKPSRREEVAIKPTTDLAATDTPERREDATPGEQHAAETPATTAGTKVASRRPRNPKLAAKDLRRVVRILGRYDWRVLSPAAPDAVAGSVARLNLLAEELEKRPRAPKSFEIGAIVRLRSAKSRAAFGSLGSALAVRSVNLPHVQVETADHRMTYHLARDLEIDPEVQSLDRKDDAA